MIAVVRDGIEIPMKYYLHRGLIVNIEYFKAQSILDDAKLVTKDWHWTADQYRNRIVIYELGGWLRTLDDAVSKSDKASSSEAIRKSFMMMTESIAVLRNDILKHDKIGVLMRGRVIAEDAARILLLINRRYVTTTSWFWKIVFDLPNKPKEFKLLVEKMSGFVPTTGKEVAASSERMYKEMSQLVHHHGIRIERLDLWV